MNTWLEYHRDSPLRLCPPISILLGSHVQISARKCGQHNPFWSLLTWLYQCGKSLQISTVYGATGWYKEITRKDVASPTTNTKKLVATEASKKLFWEVLDWVIQLRPESVDMVNNFRKVPTTLTTSVANSTTYCQRRQRHRAVARPGLTPLIKPTKVAPDNKWVLVMRINVTKKNNKHPV